MSRTTTALKRLGVPSLAAVTLIAGLPLFLGTAQAAHVGSLTLTPETSSASVGTCRTFTVTLGASSGRQLDATETVDVFLTERTASGPQDVSFCTRDTDGDATNNPQSPDTGNAAGTDVGTAGTTTRAEFTGTRSTDGTVTVRFGVEATEPGTVDIRAFYEPDTADNNNFDGTELNDTSVLTVTAGNNPVNNRGVASLDAEPESQNVFRGETATVTATIRNASNDTLAGVTPQVVFNSGPNSTQQVNCTPSNNEGVSNCTYVPANTGTDTLTVFVDQGGTAPVTGAPTAGNGQLDGNEPQDTVTVTTAANPTNLIIDVTCNGPATDASSNNCVNPSSSTTETFTAKVTGPDGTDAGTDRDPVQGAIVRFTDNAANATVSPVEATTDANGVATTTLTRTGTTVQDIVVTGTIRGQNASQDGAAQRSSDSATKEFRGANQTAADARTITLTPATAETVAGDARTFTATVTDRFGIAVQGVTVDFTETGPGRFISGSSNTSGTTNAAGQTAVEVIAFRDERGAQTITAAIGGRGTGTADDECEQAAGFTRDGSDANTTPDAQGGASPAGVCSDSSTNTYVAAISSPSATPTSSISPSPSRSPQGPGDVACTVPARVALDRDTITATGSAGITVTGTPNSVVNVLAYSRPSTTFRVVRRIELGADGRATDRIVPPTNTRLYAQQVGCDAGPQIVLNVRTALSLAVERLGTRTYRFSGDSLPARPGGLIISLYRVTNDGRQVLTSQVRADSRTGEWTLDRRFTGTGRFGFVVRTGQDLQNAPGSSNVRSLLVF